MVDKSIVAIGEVEMKLFQDFGAFNANLNINIKGIWNL